MSVTLTLDGYVFVDFEIPDAMPFGGSQALSSKRLIGGAKIVDAMGPDEHPIEWTGRFRGQDAVSRAQELVRKRKAGKTLSLTWGELAFSVKIAEFKPVYEQAFEVTYSISCEVIPDTAAAGDIGIDQMLAADNETAQGLGDDIGDDVLSGHLSTLGSAIASVTGFAKAAQSQIASVLAPISAIQSRVTTLLGAADSMLLSVAAIGGVLPGMTGPNMVSGLLAQASAMGQSANLQNLSSVVGRMATNLNAIGRSGAQVVTVGGDLYSMAEAAYGDATEWATIARANDLTDPLLAGIQTILVPPSPGGTAGILG